MVSDGPIGAIRNCGNGTKECGVLHTKKPWLMFIT
jgi:hypothetical protein